MIFLPGGGATLSEAIVARDQLITVLSCAGMHVGKWATNCPDLNTPEETVSALCLCWLSSADAFHFKISLTNSSERVRKRSMLSEIARFFDPVDWLSPVVIHAKIMLQKLWMQGVGWDDPVPEKLRCAWIKFRDQMVQLQLIKIPRWFGSSKISEWEMHGFCDASERAYAAAMYIVLCTSQGMSSRRIAAKAKVAPIKVLSIPKLELCGAHLLVKLATYILNKLEKRPVAVHCLTDSEIVLV